MSKEKQIEEMACDMCTVIANCNSPYDPIASCAAYRCAKKAYEKGYRKQSEWISVEDGIPKKWQKCLCYYPEKDYGSKIVVDYAETDSGGFAEQFRFGKPSHWMPLPQPPKMKGGAE